MRSVGFTPVATPDSRVLILGSLPGRRSLEVGEYYAQPRNAFWRIMGHLFAFDAARPYAERLAALHSHGIALWDVCKSADRAGSLDSAISESSVQPNDFAAFFAAHADIELVCFNGAKAQSLYQRHVLKHARLLPDHHRFLLLPSTSPAHAAMPFAQKLQHWSVVRTPTLPSPRAG